MASEEIEIIGTIALLPEGLAADLVIGSAETARKIRVSLIEEQAEAEAAFGAQQNEPIPLPQLSNTFWAYRGMMLKTELRPDMMLAGDRLATMIKHRVMREERRWGKIEREVAALENLERLPSARRERIPDGVRLFVWQRDEAKCVQCASQVNLEFDHIIPVVKGGANTERNIQLLCETCNRRKGAQI